MNAAHRNPCRPQTDRSAAMAFAVLGAFALAVAWLLTPATEGAFDPAPRPWPHAAISPYPSASLEAYLHRHEPGLHEAGGMALHEAEEEEESEHDDLAVAAAAVRFDSPAAQATRRGTISRRHTFAVGLARPRAPPKTHAGC